MARQRSNWVAAALTLLSVALPVVALADCPVVKKTAVPLHPCCPKPKPAVPLPAQCFAGCLTTASEPAQFQAHMKVMGLEDALPISAVVQHSRREMEFQSPFDVLFQQRDLYILLRVLRR